MCSIITTRPLEVLAMDFTQLEPATDCRKNVLALTDIFAKFTVAIPTRDQKALTLAMALPRDFINITVDPLRLKSSKNTAPSTT